MSHISSNRLPFLSLHPIVLILVTSLLLLLTLALLGQWYLSFILPPHNVAPGSSSSTQLSRKEQRLTSRRHMRRILAAFTVVMLVALAPFKSGPDPV